MQHGAPTRQPRRSRRHERPIIALALLPSASKGSLARPTASTDVRVGSPVCRKRLLGVEGQLARICDDAGLGVVGLIATLAILAVLAGVGVTTLGGASPKSTGSVGTSASSETGAAPAGAGALIAQTTNAVTEDNLRSALTFVEDAAATAGDYGKVTVQSLLVISGEHFTSGPSTNTAQISVAVAGGKLGGVTLAARSLPGICLFVWSSNTATWYGAATGDSRCLALALTAPPSASSVRSGEIGWQQGDFPSP